MKMYMHHDNKIIPFFFVIS